MLISAFATSGDSFVKPILAHLGDEHETMLWRGRNIEQFLAADLIWCDWADAMAVQVSRQTDRPMIVRFHSYELFTDFPGAIDLSKVRHLIFVADHVRRRAVARWPAIADVPTSVIPNVIPWPAEPPPPKTWGDRVAMVGTISHKKGPCLAVEACWALRAAHPDYTFHWAGELADERYRGLFDDAIAEGLPLTLHGRVEDVPAWLADKDLFLNTSPWEGQAVSILEAVAAGCVPLIHAWPGARDLYPSHWVWSETRQMVALAEAHRKCPDPRPPVIAKQLAANLTEARKRFGPEHLDRIAEIVRGVEAERAASRPALKIVRDRTTVAAAMIVKNEARGLRKCLRSIKDLVDEVYLFDTGSTDGTRGIAAKAGCKVYTDPVPQSVAGRIHFGDARNLIIGKVPDRFRWILIIDGDEAIVDAGNLLEALQTEDHDAIGVKVRSVGDQGIANEQIQPRLFRRGRIQYEYAVHNQPTGWDRLLVSTAIVHAHYEGKQEEKARRSIPILKAEEEADPTNPRWAKHLARTYLMLAGETQLERHLRTALIWARRCRDLAQSDPRHAEIWPVLVRLTAQIAGVEAAEKEAAEGLALFPDLADLRYEQLMLAAYQWHNAAAVAGTKYPFVGQGSPRLAPRLPQVAQILELPIQFGGR